MKNTDILTGRIVQKILSQKLKNVDEACVLYGISSDINIERLINNLFEFFPDGKITLKKMPLGYELNIKVRFRKEVNI